MSAAPSRRMLAGLTAATLLFGGLALAGSASAGTPTAGCNTLTDPKGDSLVQGAYAEPELDLTGLVLGADATTLQAVLRVDALSTSPDTAPGDSFNVTFTYNKHLVSFGSIRFDPDSLGAPQDAAATATATAPAGRRSPRVRMTVDGTYVPSTLKAAYDLKASTVSFAIPRAELATAAGGAFADGDPLTALYGRAATSFPFAGGLFTDSTAADNSTGTTAKDVWTIGDNVCFGGAPAPGPTVPPVPTPTATPPVEGPLPLFAFPRNGCVLFKDAAADAFPGKTPVSSPLSDGDLDFTAAAVRSDADAILVFAKITALAKEPETPPFDGHKFSTSFVINGKTITAVASATGAAVTTSTTAKATAKFDTAKSYVVFTFPKADLETAAGAPITDGTPITNLALVSNALFSGGGGDFDGDKAAGTTPAEKSYATGDNTCFKPPPAVLTIDTTGKGVFSDPSIVDVTVTDADENALAGVKVQLQLTGMPVMTLAVDDDGIAEFTFPITVAAGSKTLTAKFLGNADAGPAEAAEPFTVSADTTLLKAVAGIGKVTATLTDNDKAPVVGKLVAFKVGTKVTKVTTNAKGVAVLSRLTKGTSVTVSFAGTAGKYLAAKAVTVKVL